MTQGTDYSITVIASDESGNEANPVIVPAQTSAITAAPVPTRNAVLVRSVYCDAYETALAHDFLKNTWTGIPYSELNIDGDHVLAYTNPNVPAQMPDVAWGVNNDEGNAIIAKDGFNDGTNKGLDVRNMQYIHFDIWSSVATTYPELRLNDTPAGSIVLDGSGWQSFDLDITSLTDAQKSNIRWIKFIAFRDPAPEDIVIDNVYFFKNPEEITIREDASNESILAEKDGMLANVTVNRSFTADNLYTLVLPFNADAAMTAEKLPGQLTKLSNTIFKDNGDLRINFVDAEAIEAGVPYLYTPSANIANPVFTGVTVRKDLNPSASDANAKYYGIYAPTTGAWLKTHVNDAYVLGSDQYLYAASVLRDEQPMNALRGYFVLNFQTSGANAPRARVIFNNKETEIATSISDVQSENVQCTKLIRDGQLLIMKGNRTYNAQGQLIK